MDNRPILVLTQGDPAGIGPEVTLKSLLHPEVYQDCIPVILGDKSSLELTAAMLNRPVSLHAVADPTQAEGRPGAIDYIDLGLLSTGSWKMGKVSSAAGAAAFAYVKAGIDLALAGKAEAVVTAPINKEAINLAGHHFAGHTEIFSHYTGVSDYAMMLVAGKLRVTHVTTHMSMRNACDAVTKERVLRTIRLAKEATELMDVQGPIAVAGLNAHCSENGLFGWEEERGIIPAIKQAQSEGITVVGPIPPDTVFVKALAGQYAMVVAMYHDQGHIPVKLAGFRMDEKTGEFSSVSGINCTIGLPVIRTSVDHGTAFDRAGRGVANEESMIDAIRMAAVISRKRRKDVTA